MGDGCDDVIKSDGILFFVKCHSCPSDVKPANIFGLNAGIELSVVKVALFLDLSIDQLLVLLDFTTQFFCRKVWSKVLNFDCALFFLLVVGFARNTFLLEFLLHLLKLSRVKIGDREITVTDNLALIARKLGFFGHVEGKFARSSVLTSNSVNFVEVSLV